MATNIFGNERVSIDGFPIDVSTGETHEHDGEATEYPREEGTDAIDHVRIKPARLSLDCVVSDTPLGDLAQDSTRLGGTPSLVAYSKLLLLRATSKAVTVVTSLSTFKNMVITNLSVPRESGEPHQLHFKVDMIQAEFVQNTRKRVAVPHGNGGANLGEKLAKTAAPLVTVYTIAKVNIDTYRTSANIILVEKNGDVHFQADYPATPPPDGYVTQGVYHSFAGQYDPATAQWKNTKGQVAKLPLIGGPENQVPSGTSFIDSYNKGVLAAWNGQ